MTFALLIHGAAMPGGVMLRVPESGHYIQMFDVGLCTGLDSFLTTLDIHNAAHFTDVDQALAFWKTQSRIVPFRDNGQPNRPLTCFTVEVVPVPPS